jgi:hypothetical protein
MAYEEVLQSITLVADSSIGIYTGVPGQPGSPASPNHGGKQFRFVKITGSQIAGLATSHNDIAIGVLQNKPQATGDSATVAIKGVSMVVAGEQLATPGVAVGADSDGRAVAVGDGRQLGVILKAAGAAGQLVPVLLTV